MNLVVSNRIALLAAAASLLSGCKGCKSENKIHPNDVAPAVDTFDHDWGSWLSMATLPDGSPAIAYYDATVGGLGFAVAAVGDDGSITWTREEVDGYAGEDGLDAGDRGKYASMVVAADGTVWIAYQDLGLRTLRYAVREAGGVPGEGVWSSNVADIGGGATSDAGYFASLTLDGNGSPVAVHYDQGQGNLRITRWIGGAFTGEVLAEGTDYTPPAEEGSEEVPEVVPANVGEFAKIVISAGIEYVAYYDRAHGDLKLSWGNPGAHTIETIDGGGDAGGDVGQWPDLLVNSGTIHVAYHDVGNQDLRYVSGEPGAWTIQTVDSGDFVGADTDIYLSGGSPAIAYFDGQNNDMKRAVLSGNTWSLDTVTGSDGAKGFHNEVVTTAGATYAACYDYTKRTVWFSAL